MSAVTVAVISPTRSGVRSSVVVNRNSLCVDSGVGDGVSAIVADSAGIDAPDGAVDVGVAVVVSTAAVATGAVRRLASTRSPTTEARHVDIARPTTRSRITVPDGEWCWEKTGVETRRG